MCCNHPPPPTCVVSILTRHLRDVASSLELAPNFQLPSKQGLSRVGGVSPDHVAASDLAAEASELHSGHPGGGLQGQQGQTGSHSTVTFG